MKHIIALAFILGIVNNAFAQTAFSINKKEEAETACSFTPNELKTNGFNSKEHCKSCYLNPDLVTCPESKSESKYKNDSNKQSCQTQYDKWSESASESKEACDSLAGVPGKSCEEQVLYCQNQINGGIAGYSTSNDSLSSITGMILGQLDASNKNNVGPVKSANAGCFNYSNDKIDQAKKTLDDNIKETKKLILEKRKEITEAKKEQKEKEAEIKSEIQKLQAELDKSKADIEKSKREKYNDYNKQLQAELKKIKDLNAEIISKQAQLESTHFEHQKTMLQFAGKKIETACKSQLMKAKKCVVRVNTGEKIPDSDQCKAFDIEAGSGAKGTGEAKKKLKEISEACFEQAQSAVSTTLFKHNANVQAQQLIINQLQDDITAAKDRMNAESKNLDAINKESETELSNAEKNFSDQKNIMNEKLTNLANSTLEANRTAEEAIADMNNDLNELMALKLSNGMDIQGQNGKGVSTDFGRKVVSNTNMAIKKNENARIAASEACGCIPTSTDLKCKNLKQGSGSRNTGYGSGSNKQRR